MRRATDDVHEVVTTTGGARAVRDKDVGEVMHPVVGPLIEARALYVGASRLDARLAEANDAPLVLFDVGLGAGSNAIAARAVSEARSVGGRRLHLVSFDRTDGALALAARPENAASFGFRGDAGDAARAVLDRGVCETEQTRWKLVLGELPGALVDAGGALADIVFWDPFSPRANPELWSLAAFTTLRSRCGPRATVHTYSAATATRAAMLLAGFFVGRGAASASKKESTIAATDIADLERPLDARWLERLGRSSAPFPSDAPADAMARAQGHRQFR